MSKSLEPDCRRRRHSRRAAALFVSGLALHPGSQYMPALPFILLAAVIQGWSLYGLHHSLEFHHWPATNQPWLMALYALAVFVPLTVQMLADYARKSPMWQLVAILGAGYFYFGWHHGTAVFP